MKNLCYKYCFIAVSVPVGTYNTARKSKDEGYKDIGGGVFTARLTNGRSDDLNNTELN